MDSQIGVKGNLRRLSAEFYMGLSFVHWSMTVADRKSGWLDDAFHYLMREVMLHTLVRYRLSCPIYCLMPDHMHILWVGLRNESDQLDAAQFFRKYVNRQLRESGNAFQKQAYDNVLREKDRDRDAVIRLAYYISENPVRAGFVSDATKWMFGGSMMAGYPELDWRVNDFSERFWKCYAIEVNKAQA